VVCGCFVDPPGVLLTGAEESEEASGDGAEGDVGVADGEASGGLASLDVAQSLGISYRGEVCTARLQIRCTAGCSPAGGTLIDTTTSAG
jgi:hypothetical protein